MRLVCAPRCFGAPAEKRRNDVLDSSGQGSRGDRRTALLKIAYAEHGVQFSCLLQVMNSLDKSEEAAEPPAAAAPRLPPSPQQQPQYTPLPVAMAPAPMPVYSYEDDDGASLLSFIALSWSSA
jgi:hypothetical protein